MIGLSRHQREGHRLPVRVGGVLHHGPSLQEMAFLLAQHQAVARLPDRRLQDVADAHAPLPGAGEVQHHGLLLDPVRGGEHLQRLGQVVLDLLSQEADALDLAQRDAADTGLRVEVEEHTRDEPLLPCLLLAALHADDRAGQLVGQDQLDRLAPGLR